MGAISLLLAAAAAASMAAAPAPEAKAEASNKKICKMVQVTGSRVGGQRVCATKAAWDEQFRQGRDDADEATKVRSRPLVER